MTLFSPRVVLRVEGFLVLIVSACLYARLHFGWGAFAILFLAPDLSMVGYLGGKKAGAALYNGAHTYAAPFLLFLILALLGQSRHGGIALIWTAHIGFDRMLGYGIKYETAFQDTHLQRV